MIIAFSIYVFKNNSAAQKAGHIFLKLSFVTLLLSIGFLVSGIKSTTDIYPKLQAQLDSNPGQYMIAGKEIAAKQRLSAQEFSAITPMQFEQAGKQVFPEQRREAISKFWNKSG